ncbi:MAG: hypothetical protein WC359_14835 [Dehalococcoidia bacterium]|jgi:hypothetical protein
MDASRIISQHYGNKHNETTPVVVETGMVAQNVAYEISRSSGFAHTVDYWVAFVEALPDGSTKAHHGRACVSLPDARMCVDDMVEMCKKTS